jgi:hypothetical protein
MSDANPAIEVDPYQALAEAQAEERGEAPRARPPGQPAPDHAAASPVDPGSIDQAEPHQAVPIQTATPASDAEILSPAVKSKQWVIGPEKMERTYIQSELSVIGKFQWFSLVGEILDDSLTGDGKISLNSLLTPPEIVAGKPVMQQFADADTFVHAVGKLIKISPKFLTDSVCIWLSVPDYEWDLVGQMMKMSPTDGGLNDDQFEEIFNLFIDQNLPSIERFFRERFPRLRDRWQARRKEIRDPSPLARR